MKKIMIYTKHKDHLKREQPVRDHALYILFLVFYICGLLFGSSIYGSATENGMIHKIITAVLSLTAEKKCYILLITAVSILLFNVLCGFSCTGIIGCSIVPAAEGFIYGSVALHMMSSFSDNGIALFTLTVLPGAIGIVTGTVMLCIKCAQLSGKIAMNVLFGQNDMPEFKPFIIHWLLAFAFILVSIILNLLFEKLFSGIFAV